MEWFILLISLILIAGVWVARVNSRIGFPTLLGFVIIGAVIGPGGFNVVPQISPTMARYISYPALILILFEGGLHTTLRSIKRSWAPALSLSTLGVLISAAIMALIAYLLPNFSIYDAALFGVAVSSTDAASIFSMLGGQAIRKRLVDVLELESGTNDPMAFFLTVILIQWSLTGPGTFAQATWTVVSSFALQMAVGLAVGILVGFAASFINQRIKLDNGGMYPVLSLAFALFSFALAQLLHGSGFLAVYLTSVVLGTRKLDHRYSILRFHEGVAWTMNILMFVVLGLLLEPKHLVSFFLPGIIFAICALFVARPTAVWLSTIGMKFTWKEKHFLSWAGMRGAVPVVLILSAVIQHVTQYQALLDAVFFVVIASTLAQGLSVKFVANRLDLMEPAPSESLLELISIARENAMIFPVEIKPESTFINRKMVDIKFPSSTLCYGIIRGEVVIVPRGATRLQSGDHLLILSDRTHISELRTLFQQEYVGEPALLP